MALRILYDLWVAIQVLTGYNLVLPLLLFGVFLSIRKRHRGQPNSILPELDFAIIVTAYEQTDALPAAVGSLLRLNYSNFMIYVVADKCDISELHFNDKRVVVLRPPETLASNTRSHFYAVRNFVRAHSHLIIIDSDNLTHPDCLRQINASFHSGFEAVQGVREAKNLNTAYACLDAARDIYYHFYDGKLLFQLGSSATLAGSGMAFSVQLYRDCLEHLDVTGAGFDKVLQYEIVKRGKRIAFNPNAIVYDEKTSHSDQLVRQRARWINTWFKYCRFGASLLWKGITGLNINQFLFGITLLRPPLFLFITLSLIFMMSGIWLAPVSVIWWGAAFACFVLGFVVAIVRSKPDKRIVRSLVGIPRFMALQILSLLRARKANQISVATKHYSTTIPVEDLAPKL